MNELDFTEAREALVQRMSPPMPLPVIERRTRQRRRSRLAVTVAAIATAALLVAGGSLFATHRSKAIPSDVVQLTTSDRVMAVEAVDRQTAFASILLRTGGYAFARTDDGGHQWTAWTLPMEPRPEPAPAHLGIEPLTSRDIVIGPLITHDGGESWEPTLSPGSPVDNVPAGWILQTGYPTGSVQAIDPSTGQTHRLDTPPAGCLGANDQSMPTNGSLWLECTNGVAVSTDRGRHWHRGALPTAQVGILVATYDGRVGYAVINNGSTRELEKSTDGGLTWHHLRMISSIDEELYVLPDGSLVTTHLQKPPQVLLRSTDEGATFHPLDPTGPNETFGQSHTGGFVGTRWEKRNLTKYISADGVHWVPVPRPPGLPMA